MIKEYVVTFLFTTNMNEVWMVEKQKPDWQKGCLNGIGGKIEKDELPIEAAIRELKEEAGVDKMNLWELGYMFGTNNDSSGFKVWVFTGVTDLELKTMETEQILLKNINEIKDFAHIENVPMLIEACLYKLKGHSHFSRLIMEY
jgi:8-oxo-dGTP diphosphatase